MLDEEVQHAMRVLERSGVQAEVMVTWMQEAHISQLHVFRVTVNNAIRNYRNGRIARALAMEDRSGFRASYVDSGHEWDARILRWEGPTAIIEKPLRHGDICLYDDEGYCFGRRSSGYFSVEVRFRLENV